MEQQDDWTCGKGLAASAVLPERLGAVMSAMAEVLHVHMEALDPEDDASKREHEAYRRVSQQLGQVASQLDALAREMAARRRRMRLGVSAARSPAEPLPVQHLAGRLVQQRGEECPVSTVESDLLAMQRPLQGQAGAGGDPRPRGTPCGATSPKVAVDAGVTRLMWDRCVLGRSGTE